jgi:division protein CdvB (Snf7/Vps24/ESCRT-III family)
MLQVRGKRTVFDGGLSIPVKDASVESVHEILQEIADEPTMDPKQLASKVPNKTFEKWDGLLPDELLCASFASAKLDVEGVQNLLKLRLRSE